LLIMKIYRVSVISAIFAYTMLVLLTVVLPATMVIDVRPKLSLEDWPFITMLGLFYLSLWYLQFREFNRIIIHENELITFHSPIRQKTVALSDIELIKSTFIFGFAVIRHKHGKIRLMRRIDNFADFIYTIKALNPEVKVRVFGRLKSS